MFVESDSEWCARHGNTSIYVDGVYLFADGAVKEASAYGFRHEPPADLHQRAKTIRDYHKAVLAQTAESFRQLQQDLVDSARARSRDGLPPPGPSEIAKLRDLRKKVIRCRRAVTIAEKALEKTEPVVRNVKRKRELEAAKVRADHFVEDVVAVDIGETTNEGEEDDYQTSRRLDDPDGAGAAERTAARLAKPTLANIRARKGNR